MFLAFAKEESQSSTQCQEDVLCTLQKLFVVANRVVFLGYFRKTFSKIVSHPDVSQIATVVFI